MGGNNRSLLAKHKQPSKERSKMYQNTQFLPIYGRIKTTVIGTTASPAEIYFGGEWSLTAQRFTMEEVTETNLTWQPGVFAFTEEDFVACGLIVCGVAFFALGLTGRANGSKALLLALICGGAGFGYLTLI